jgi:RNA polymerase sigma-70 factor, ECF subfamily
MSEGFMHDLAARLARGDETAFAELYDACANRLYRYLLARLGSHDAAADVLQNTFLRAVKSRRRFRGVEGPLGYMFQIARNEAARHLSKRRLKESPLPAADVGGAVHEFGDEVGMIAAALARLDVVDRELVELKTYSGMTFRQVAETVGMPPGTVATRYRRAIESLRTWLAKQYR